MSNINPLPPNVGTHANAAPGGAESAGPVAKAAGPQVENLSESKQAGTPQQIIDGIIDFVKSNEGSVRDKLRQTDAPVTTDPSRNGEFEKLHHEREKLDKMQAAIGKVMNAMHEQTNNTIRHLR